MIRNPMTRSRSAAIVAAVSISVLFLAGCAAEPAAKNPIATFKVAGTETYKIELATPELLKHAEALLNGEDVAAIPLGTVVRDAPSVNEPWSWHIDPATLEFAKVTIEVCDGLPSFVEDQTITSDEYCPWSAKIIAIDK